MGGGIARHDRPGLNQQMDHAVFLTPLATVDGDVEGICPPVPVVHADDVMAWNPPGLNPPWGPPAQFFPVVKMNLVNSDQGPMRVKSIRPPCFCDPPRRGRPTLAK